MAEFAPWTAFDWNGFAALLPNLPDEVVAQMIRSAALGDALFEAWENAWRMTAGAAGIPAGGQAPANTAAFRAIMLAFYRAEAARRGLNAP
jgi:hypothetical protein